MSENKHEPDTIRAMVISEFMLLEQQGGSNRKIDLLSYLIAEALTGVKPVVLSSMPIEEYQDLLDMIDDEVKRRKEANTD